MYWSVQEGRQERFKGRGGTPNGFSTPLAGNKSIFVTRLLVNKKLIKASACCMPLAPNISAKASRPAQLLSRLICTGMRACVTGGRGRFIVRAWALKAHVLGGRGHR